MQPLADHGEDTYVGHGRLEDKVALITGADSGIGRAVAIAFAREGADVLCSYWKEDEDAARDPPAGRGRRPALHHRARRHRGSRALPSALVERRRRRARAARRARQQRRLPDGATTRSSRTSRPRSSSSCSARTSSRCSTSARRRSPHGAGLDDRQHDLDPGRPAQPGAAALRGDEGRDQHVHQGARAGARRARHPRQRRRAPARSGRRWSR